MEMLVSTMLVWIAAAVAFPSVVAAWEQLSVRGAMDQFAAAHHKARTAAVRYGRVAELHIDTANSRFWVELDTSVSMSRVMDTVGGVVDLGENRVVISASTLLLCFDARGLVAVVSGCPGDGSGTFTLTRADAADTLTTTSGGVPWDPR